MAKALLEQKVEDFQPAPMDDLVTFGNDASLKHISKFPRICSINHLSDMEYLSPIAELLYDTNSYKTTLDFYHNARIDDVEKPKLGEIAYQYPYMDAGKTQVLNQDSSFSQPIVVNPVYDMHGFEC